MKGNIWWNQTPGPSRMINDIVSYLINGKAVWLNSERHCWDHDRRMILKGRISECDCRKNIEFIDAQANGNELIHKVILGIDPSVDRPTYYPSQKFEDYMVKNRVCDGCILWVYNLQDGEVTKRWLDLSRQLAARKSSAVIACEGSIPRSIYKNVEIIYPMDFISEFDVLHFVMTSVSEYNRGILWKTYISRLITEIVGYDVEKCDHLIQNINSFAADPEVYCNEVIDGIDGNELKKRIWNAQIKSIYPMIEQKRLELVSRNKSRLLQVLPFQDEWNEEFRTTEDMELRHIVHFYNKGDITLPDDDYMELMQLYNMRNDLSHLKIIESDVINRFLE